MIARPDKRPTARRPATVFEIREQHCQLRAHPFAALPLAAREAINACASRAAQSIIERARGAAGASPALRRAACVVRAASTWPPTASPSTNCQRPTARGQLPEWTREKPNNYQRRSLSQTTTVIVESTVPVFKLKRCEVSAWRIRPPSLQPVGASPLHPAPGA